MNKSTFFIIGQHAVIEALKNPNDDDDTDPNSPTPVSGYGQEEKRKVS